MEIINFGWYALPWVLMLIAIFLCIITVYLFRVDRRRDRNARRKVRHHHALELRRADAKGYKRGFDAGHARGAEDAFTENETFIQCPECDHAVHVPLVAIIEGETGAQTIRAEADTTALWLHMEGHTGKTAADGQEAPHEL